MIVRWLLCVCLLALPAVTAVMGQQSGNEQRHRFSLPNKNWSLDVSLADFYIIGEEIKTKESVYEFSASQFPEKSPPSNKKNPPRLLFFAVHMEPAQIKGTAADFRDFARKKMTKQDVVAKESVKPAEYEK